MPKLIGFLNDSTAPYTLELYANGAWQQSAMSGNLLYLLDEVDCVRGEWRVTLGNNIILQGVNNENNHT